MIGVLFSGGKDSTLTAFIMQQQGFDIKLITFLPEKMHSYMLHDVNLHITSFQAKAMGVEHSIYKVSGEKEKEVYEMLKELQKERLDGIAAGAYKSEYQKQRVEYIAEKLGIPSYTPLWHKNYLEDLNKLKIILVKASSYDLREEHLGKEWRELDEEIKKTLLEGGEGETVVLDAPFFKKRIDIVEYKKHWEKQWGFLEIKKVELIKKQ